MPPLPGRAAGDGVRPLLISLAWMFAVQLACVALWDQGWLTRQAALAHWLAVGVLPPALALWRTGRPASPAGGA